MPHWSDSNCQLHDHSPCMSRWRRWISPETWVPSTRRKIQWNRLQFRRYWCRNTPFSDHHHTCHFASETKKGFAFNLNRLFLYVTMSVVWRHGSRATLSLSFFCIQAHFNVLWSRKKKLGYILSFGFTYVAPVSISIFVKFDLSFIISLVRERERDRGEDTPGPSVYISLRRCQAPFRTRLRSICRYWQELSIFR